MKYFLPVIFLTAALCSCTDKKQEVVPIKDSASIDSPVQAASIPIIRADSLPATDHFNDSIVPGKSIGKILLEAKLEDVIQILGEPNSQDAAMGKSISIWTSSAANDTIKNSLTVYATSNFGTNDEAARVKMLRVTSPRFRTDLAIGPGSTLSFIRLRINEIRKASHSYASPQYGEVRLFDDPAKGICFEINEAEKCIGVTVHKSGKGISDVYLPMFPGLKKM